jgi:hypothetical protein
LQVGQVKNPPFGTSAESLQWGQAGVPSTHEGRVVVGKIAIQAAFQRGELLGTLSEKREWMQDKRGMRTEEKISLIVQICKFL